MSTKTILRIQGHTKQRLRRTSLESWKFLGNSFIMADGIDRSMLKLSMYTDTLMKGEAFTVHVSQGI